jgi:Sec-independent protein translocase protein TatA
MELFNIGLPELILILIIMLIVLGPDQTIVQFKNIARFMRKLVRSPFWSDIVETSREIKSLPQKMLRDTGLEEDVAEMNRTLNPPTRGDSKPVVKRTAVKPDDPALPSDRPDMEA